MGLYEGSTSENIATIWGIITKINHTHNYEYVQVIEGLIVLPMEMGVAKDHVTIATAGDKGIINSHYLNW